MYSFVKKLFFKDAKLRIFAITRLSDTQVEEKVFLQNGKYIIDISLRQGIICLDPFCIAVWVPREQLPSPDVSQAKLQFYRRTLATASIQLSIIEKIEGEKCVFLLYKIKSVKNYQFNPLHRLVFFAYLLRNKTSTYNYRKTISALYSYPRKIIIVSYKDEDYCNIFPMDIQGYAQEDGMYVLGLRTTNVTLDKILKAKKVVVCDTDAVDIDTVYTLGKHPSASPPKIENLPFGTTESEIFKFPVPDFSGSYKEIEIITHKKMGYHMLMIGKIINAKTLKQNTSSFYHVGFLEYLKAHYNNIDGQY